MDEVEFMQPANYNAIMGTLVAGQSFMLASTVTGTGPFSELLEELQKEKMDEEEGDAVEDDDDQIFLSRIQLCCEKCKSFGLITQCRHLSHLRPHWLKGRDQKLIARLIGGLNAAREVYGFSDKCDSTKAFRSEDVKRMFTKRHPGMQSGDDVDRVYFLIDPAAGGLRSRFTVTTGYQDGDKLVVSPHA